MLRKYKNTNITIQKLNNVNFSEKFIIQTEVIANENILIEYFNMRDNNIIDLEPLNAPATYQDNEKQAKIDEYRAIILNNNAFNDKWSDKTLGELFQANDREFIERAKKEMKNKYIQEKIIFLDKELNGK